MIGIVNARNKRNWSLWRSELGVLCYIILKRNVFKSFFVCPKWTHVELRTNYTLRKTLHNNQWLFIFIFIFIYASCDVIGQSLVNLVPKQLLLYHVVQPSAELCREIVFLPRKNAVFSQKNVFFRKKMRFYQEEIFPLRDETRIYFSQKKCPLYFLIWFPLPKQGVFFELRFFCSTLRGYRPHCHAAIIQ